MKDTFQIKELEDSVAKQKKINENMQSFYRGYENSKDKSEKEMIAEGMENLKKSLQNENKKSLETTQKILIYPPLNKKDSSLTLKNAQTETKSLIQNPPISSNISDKEMSKSKKKDFELEFLEMEALKRMKKRKQEEKKDIKKDKKPNKYVQFSSRFFYKHSMSLIKKGNFRKIERELVKSNLAFVPANYLSFMFFTTVLSFFVSIFIFLFFMFFSVIATLPIIVRTEDIFLLRLAKTFWIIIGIPAITFIFLYFYPSMERKSIETRINHELPFATIHMSAISGSLVEPSKIFSIIIETKEYPFLTKEFTKLINEINIYGYDFVTALRNRAFNSPSKKLAELFNGLATTITSGGDLAGFFDKRSQTLLFEYRIDREKESKAAETFMDIYISVVIAAPMILMLLLVMMRLSGLGFSLSTAMITIIMVLGVTLINILFLTFLHLKGNE